MKKYVKSNVKLGETRNTTLTFVVQDGACWAINNVNMSAEWIAKIEDFLIEISEYTRNGKD